MDGFAVVTAAGGFGRALRQSADRRIAAMTLQAVRDGVFYILSHETAVQGVETRLADIVERCLSTRRPTYARVDIKR